MHFLKLMISIKGKWKNNYHCAIIEDNFTDY